MKTVFLLAFTLYSLQLAAQWHSFVPSIPDTVGTKSLDAVDEQTAWAIALQYKVDTLGFQFAGADTGYFFRTTDGGASWSAGPVPMAPAPYLNGISAVDENTAWVSGLDFGDFSNHIVHTGDGGLTWTPQLTDGFQQPTSYVNFIHFWDAQNGIAGGDPAASDTDTIPFYEIWRTGDGGQNWARVPAANIPPRLPDEYGSEGSFSVYGQHIWFTAFTNTATPIPDRIFHSADQGLHWEVIQTDKPYLGFLSFADDTLGATAYYDLATGGHRYLLTRNGGLTWTDITPPGPPSFAVSFTMVPAAGALVLVQYESPVAGPFTTRISKDLGTSWQMIGSGELAGWAKFVSPTAGYAGEWQPADHATRMYRYNGSPLTGLLSGQPLEAEVATFPNPTAGMVTVQVKTARPADFLLLLNDAQGRLIERRAIRSAAAWSEQLDLSVYPAGAYTVTISSKDGSATRTVVRQ